MNRNKNVYGDKIQAPRARSARRINTDTWTTFKSGRVIPLKFHHVLAGDTFEENLAFELRELTPAVPVMDNSFIEFGAFFVPNRIISKGIIENYSDTNDWETMFGEVKKGYWANDTETTLKQVEVYSCEPQSPANYCGIPVLMGENVIDGTAKTNLIEECAFIQVWNDHFRDPNIMPPIDIETFSMNLVGRGIDIENSDNTPDITNDWAKEKGINLFPVCKKPDYFTTALRAPQRGEPTQISLGTQAPVVAGDPANIVTNNHTLKMVSPSGASIANHGPLYTELDGTLNSSANTSAISGNHSEAVPGNLIADLTKAEPITVNNLRQLFAVQQIKERSARAGSRYYQYLLSAFGTAPNDSTLQRSEYLGGYECPVNVTQVLQTSAPMTSQQTPLGTTGAFSNTSNYRGSFIKKSFTEPGVIMICCWVRTQQSYSQGISCMKTKFRQYDFYDPMFANLGEQPIYNSELFVSKNETDNNGVFGYKQAWQEYRIDPNTISGQFSANAPASLLSKWTYTNKFANTPTLSKDFIIQSNKNIDDTLIKATTSQFLINVHFSGIKVSEVPSMSIPALLGGM